MRWTKITQKKEPEWKIINKEVGVRPVVQEYSSYDELPPIPVSFPTKGASGNTGDWRTFKPIIDQEKCTKCGQCYIFCPEGVILWIEDKEIFEIDYQYCKGCGICYKQCPLKAIEMILEEK